MMTNCVPSCPELIKVSNNIPLLDVVGSASVDSMVVGSLSAAVVGPERMVGGFPSKFLADLLVGVEALICTLVPPPAEPNIVRAVHEISKSTFSVINI